MTHLGALGRHLAANMPQLCAKIHQDNSTSSQHRARQRPRCLNHPIQRRPNTKKLKKTCCFYKFFDTQPLYQNGPKMLKKSSLSLQNRSQDAQDTAKMASWTSTWKPKASKSTPKRAKKVLFLYFFGPFFETFYPSCHQTLPKTTQIAPKRPQTPSGRRFF